MNSRKNALIEGIPYEWTTNLSDEQVREFYALYGARIAESELSEPDSNLVFSIRIRIAFLPFEEGFALWSASGSKHTVLYRSLRDWELWNARQQELEELREEQTAEQAIEKTLVLTEDAHLKSETEAAIAVKDYDNAAAHATARAELRYQFRHFGGMSVAWKYWYPDLIFGRFPTSRQGIEFFKRFHPLPHAFSNFAHWFSVRSGLQGDALVEQTGAVYEEGLKMFPASGSLAQAASLFFRRVGIYDLAIAVCIDAIKRGLRDGTKSGFGGRLRRLQRESESAKLRL